LTRRDLKICPKCGFETTAPGTECQKCGLIFAKWKARIATFTDTPSSDATIDVHNNDQRPRDASSVAGMEKERRPEFLRRVPMPLLILLFFPVMFVVLILLIVMMGFAYAPFLALASVLMHYSHKRPPEIYLYFSLFSGGYGVLFAATLASAILNNLRLSSNIRTTATSKADSVAMGIVEMKGIARKADAEFEEELVRGIGNSKPEGAGVDISNEMGEKALIFCYDESVIRSPGGPVRRFKTFYLEDRTGRVLIDPRTADDHEIMLSRHVERHQVSSGGDPIGITWKWLQDGDPLYVLGTAQRRMINGRETVVIAPFQARATIGYFKRLFSRFHMLHDTFRIADTTEQNAVSSLTVHNIWMLFFLIIMLVSSVWLLYFCFVHFGQ